MNIPGPIPSIDHQRWAIFSDFDGTLVDIAPHPSAIVVSDALIQLLQALDQRFGGALALVSGRSLKDLKRHTHNIAISMAGSHGAEWQTGAQQPQSIQFDEGLFSGYKQSIQDYARSKNLLVEDKGFSIAVHTRGKENEEHALDHFLNSLNIQNGFKILGGKAIREIKPEAVNKGLALTRFCEMAPFNGRRPLFLGDDLTDEDAFEVVNRVGGTSIKVGEGETRAHYRLASPSDVQTFLAQLL